MKYIDFVNDVDKISKLENVLEIKQNNLKEKINTFLKSKLFETKNIIVFNNPLIIDNEELLEGYKAEELYLDDQDFYIKFKKPNSIIYTTLLFNINNEDILKIIKIIFEGKYALK